MRLLEKIYIYLNYILFWLLYIPMVLVVYLSDKISDAYKNWDSTYNIIIVVYVLIDVRNLQSFLF